MAEFENDRAQLARLTKRLIHNIERRKDLVASRDSHFQSATLCLDDLQREFDSLTKTSADIAARSGHVAPDLSILE